MLVKTYTFLHFGAPVGLGGFKLDELGAANPFLRLWMAQNSLKWLSQTSWKSVNIENCYETDFYKSKRRIDDMNLHKKWSEFSWNSGVGQLIDEKQMDIKPILIAT